MNKIILALDKDYDSKDVSDILTSMFEEKTSFARYKVDQYKEKCLEFEKKHNINSNEFIKKFESGEMGDDAVFFDWFAAKKGFDIWNKKLNILKGVSVQ